MQTGLLDWMQENKKNISVKKTVKSKFSLFSNLVECLNDNLLVFIIVPWLCKMQYKLWERHIELSTIFQLFCKSKTISKYLFFKNEIIVFLLLYSSLYSSSLYCYHFPCY